MTTNDEMVRLEIRKRLNNPDPDSDKRYEYEVIGPREGAEEDCRYSVLSNRRYPAPSRINCSLQRTDRSDVFVDVSPEEKTPRFAIDRHFDGVTRYDPGVKIDVTGPINVIVDYIEDTDTNPETPKIINGRICHMEAFGPEEALSRPVVAKGNQDEILSLFNKESRVEILTWDNTDYPDGASIWFGSGASPKLVFQAADNDTIYLVDTRTLCLIAGTEQYKDYIDHTKPADHSTPSPCVTCTCSHLPAFP